MEYDILAFNNKLVEDFFIPRTSILPSIYVIEANAIIVSKSIIQWSIRSWVHLLLDPYSINISKFTGRSLHCQVEHHVQTKFATPILHAIENL